MKIDIKDGRDITILVDENKNIVIFPISALGHKVADLKGEMYEPYWEAYFPIEVKYPYTEAELAEKIEYAFSQWCKHPCYDKMDGKNTFEEKYYGIKGFRNAIKGKRYMRAGWNDLTGVRINFYMPLKGSYAYIVLNKIKFDVNADEHDFAKAVIHFANVDLESLKSFKTYKRNLIL